MRPTIDTDFNAKMRHTRFGVAANNCDAFAPRVSGIPIGGFRETLGERIERWGNNAVGVAMALVAVFIVLGLAFGWI